MLSIGDFRFRRLRHLAVKTARGLLLKFENRDQLMNGA